MFPGAIAEMQRVAGLDPMIGFVSPRSNNATICSFPPAAGIPNLPPEQSHAVFLQLSGYLPEFHYVPVAVGFCLFIKFLILDEFGLLDEIYGRGYNEENDLIMRANRCGYRAALANHAFVYHFGEASFSHERQSQGGTGEAQFRPAAGTLSGVPAEHTQVLQWRPFSGGKHAQRAVAG